MEVEEILDHIETIFPETPCELRNDGEWQFAIAVALSPQTTDKKVNEVTKVLFELFPSLQAIADANPEEIEAIVKPLGYGKNRARNLIAICRMLLDEYDGKVPADLEALMKLPGIGRKCAGVIAENLFGIPVMAVDTHVERISKRLGLADFDDSVRTVEDKLTQAIPEYRLGKAHHDFIHFGRYFCTSRNPNCKECPFASFCHEKDFSLYRKEKKEAKGKKKLVKKEQEKQETNTQE